MLWVILVMGILGAIAVFFTDVKIQVAKIKAAGVSLSKREKFFDKIGTGYLFTLLLLVILLVWSILAYFIYYGFNTGEWIQLLKSAIALGACEGILLSSLFIYWLKHGHLVFWRREKRCPKGSHH
ncbi:hypothetical protein MUP35_02350 [Patescibacteria group bacterium]|nr:hypothetical protein [Patescibacteria group bacterium]